jgi:type IV pilus assembly protein PilO
MVPKIVDTPQLIYDFYNQCSLYNITDSRINFELLDSTEVGNSNFHRLEVDLKIEANKQDVEKFIENLNSITSRRLNVKEIKMYLPSYEDTTKGENGSSEVDDSESTDLFEDNFIEDSYFEDSDLLGAEIIFNEYIKGDYKTIYPKNYVFYNSEKEGFGSISDMFK